MKTKLLLLTFLTLSLTFQNLMAVNADPNPITLMQADGSSLIIKQIGDEFFHYAVSLDGYTLIRNTYGIFEYAMHDQDNNLIASGVKAHNTEIRSTFERNFLSEIPLQLAYAPIQIQKIKEQQTIKRTSAKRGVFPTTGTNKLIMILANFSDTDTTYSQQKFNDYMNKQGGSSGKGSFKDYYTEVSYGQLTVNTTVTAWVTVPHSHAYYGSDTKWADFAYDAIKQADSLGIDFSQFDNDGDGLVDGVAVIHQGKGQEASGNTEDIWSHSWNLQSAGYTNAQRTFDGVKVGAYTLQPERYGSNMSTIGVMCHEFGHNLGAPDFYDTNDDTGGRHVGSGDWDLMASGSWNGSPAGSTPAHINMYTKIAFNWVTPIDLWQSGDFSLNYSEVYPEAYILKTPDATEYFLLENRQKHGFDQSIPGHGLIIYHVDEDYISLHSRANDINASEHQGLYPVAANGTINSAGCPFPGTSGAKIFTDFSTPASITWEGELVGRPIIEILEQDSIITFKFLEDNVANPTWLPAVSASNQLELHWNFNENNDSVILAWSLDSLFSAPLPDTNYFSGDTLPSGAQILFVGNTQDSVIHNNLEPGITYYYKLYSFNGSFYSRGRMQGNNTLCFDTYSTPFVQQFEMFHGTNPGTCWKTMRNTEEGGGLNGNNLTDVVASDSLDTWMVISPESLNEHGAEFIYEGNRAIYIPGYAIDYNWLISPELQLPGGYADLNFYCWYATIGSMGSHKTEFKVLVKTHGNWELVLDWNNAKNNYYKVLNQINLDAYIGQVVQIAFVYPGKAAYQVALDNIEVRGAETARPVNALFMLTHNSNPLEGATIIFDGITQLTDSLGQSLYEGHLPENGLSYTITKEGFPERTGTLDLINDTLVEIAMWPVGIEQTSAEGFYIYPNPVDEVLTIASSAPANTRYELFTMGGKLLQSGFIKAENTQVDVSSLKPGIYFIHLRGNTLLKVKKVIKK